MTERYIDPNSGAAPQPGGYAIDPAATKEAGEAREAAIDDAVSTPETEDVEPTPEPEDVAAASITGAPDPDAEGLVLSEDGQSTVDAETGEPHEEEPAEEVTDDDGDRQSLEDELPDDDQIQLVEGKEQAAEPSDDDATGDTTEVNADASNARLAEEEGKQAQEEAQTAAEADERPAGNASRDAWVDYAKSDAGGNLTDEDLEGKGRDEIRDLYS